MAVRLRTKTLVVFFSVLFLFSLILVGGTVALGAYLDIGISDSEAFVVSIADHDEGEDITPVVQEAIAYWNENNEQYPAAFQKRFEFRENASNPDVLVRYRSSVSCEIPESNGCAPIVSSKRDAEDSSKPLVVQVSASQTENRLMAKRTLIHEFGHLLSVSHCEEPRSRMGCPQSTAPVGPTWDERRYPFNTTELRVYVDTDGASDPMEATVDRSLEAATAGEMEDVPSSVTFQRVDQPWKSHITIRVNECSNCQPQATAILKGGPPYDPAIQYMSHAEIRVTAESAGDVETWLAPHLKEYSGNESNPRRPAP